MTSLAVSFYTDVVCLQCGGQEQSLQPVGRQMRGLVCPVQVFTGQSEGRQLHPELQS